jgi:cysteine synthase A
MRFLGARVILTPASEKGTGMLAKAIELAEKHGWFLCRQFENEANADMHSRTTAPEILRDFAGKRLDYWVTGAGTAGTLKGVSRVLKKERPETKVVVCEPDNAPIMGSKVPQQYTKEGRPAESHPYFRPHLMQGWTPDFIPKLANDVIEAGLIDEIMPINGADALRYAKELALKEGIFCGISAGATFAGAVEIAKRAPKGSVILCMLPDTGERYLSTVLFEDIATDMTEEEKAIAASTPRYRFDACAPPPPAAEAPKPKPAKPEAIEFVETTLASPDEPVVLFALEWCEFSWSVRKMFSALGIPYRSIDLDSVPYQKDNWGGEIRIALRERIGTPTIPQIFVGEHHVGGATETFSAYNDGTLKELLKAQGVGFEAKQDLDAYSFMPTWLHPR